MDEAWPLLLALTRNKVAHCASALQEAQWKKAESKEGGSTSQSFSESIMPSSLAARPTRMEHKKPGGEKRTNQLIPC